MYDDTKSLHQMRSLVAHLQVAQVTHITQVTHKIQVTQVTHVTHSTTEELKKVCTSQEWIL